MTRPPYAAAPIERYSRLFAPTGSSFDLHDMAKLGRSMERRGHRIPEARERTPLPAGYTYFGQFMDHDLTRDETPFRRAMETPLLPGQTGNAAGARLRLNHLYGEGPGSKAHGHVYEPDGATFRLGEARSQMGVRFDLPVGQDGPESADVLNSENVIIRQMCALFLRLHNLAVNELPDSVSPAERFQRARQRVSWQYQWLVREDYLYRITRPEVYQEIVLRSRPEVDWGSTGFSIPVEFSLAAFRFGHSMVREEYDLNPSYPRISLGQLLTLGQQKTALDPAMAIGWNRFLDVSLNTAAGRGRLPAMPIDTALAPSLFRIPKSHLRHTGDETAELLPAQLAVLTLQRGARMALATGEEIAPIFGLTPLRDRGLPDGGESWAILDQLGLGGRTPLWYYILLEAQLEARGVTLGTLGSRLVLEVIDGSLRTDPNSYLSLFGAKWEPPPWRLPDGGRKAIRRLLDVATVTGLAESS